MATDAISNDELEAIAMEVRAVVETLVTEDDTPVDNVFSEKQQRLLTEPLFCSWSGPGEGRPFVAMANVGLFYALRGPPVVPDVLLSLGVKLPADIRLKHNRSYFVWEYGGKAPEVVIEIVSNREGGEDTKKLATYAEIGIRYYVIYDPDHMLGAEALRVYRLEGMSFHRLDEPIWFREVGLGLDSGRVATRTWTTRGCMDRCDGHAGAHGTRRQAGRAGAPEVEHERAETERQRRTRSGSEPSNSPHNCGSLASSRASVRATESSSCVVSEESSVGNALRGVPSKLAEYDNQRTGAFVISLLNENASLDEVIDRLYLLRRSSWESPRQMPAT